MELVRERMGERKIVGEKEWKGERGERAVGSKENMGRKERGLGERVRDVDRGMRERGGKRGSEREGRERRERESVGIKDKRKILSNRKGGRKLESVKARRKG